MKCEMIITPCARELRCSWSHDRRSFYLSQGFEAELRAAMAAGCPTAAAVARQRRDRGATDREHWGAPVPSCGPVKALGTEQQAAPVPVAEGKPAARSSSV